MRTSLLCGLLMTVANAGSQPLIIAGRTSLPPDNRAWVTVALTDADGDTMDVDRSRSGRFRFKSFRDQAYTMHFAQPGSIPREVVVDADELPPMRDHQQVRIVHVQVPMTSGSDDNCLLSLHPSGFSRFSAGTGRLNMHYDHGADIAVERRSYLVEVEHCPYLSAEAMATHPVTASILQNANGTHITLPGANTSYTVLDLSGKNSISGSTPNGEVDVQALEPGAYIMELVADGMVQRLPFVR